MNGPETDDDLVARALRGDNRAFATLVERHQLRVYNLALRIMGNPDDAADAAQDAFLNALRKLSGFRGDAAFTTWMHRVAVNACYDILRKRRRQPMLHILPDESEGPREPGPAAPDHADEVAGTLDAHAALQLVPEEFRAVLILADVEDLPFQTIAEVLDIPLGTVKSRAHRGRIALAKALGLDPAQREPSAGPVPSKDTP